ncbi:hypothetical protein I302_102053 [Kwoniella bestiolae CBS 10118]|uniref:Uncharacterized protein n=1 Tax=Kwoniella bestiolae CBS 10118 TaxID=1296100 RepID=A0A1B9GDV6_9TREE|nr:hypothetical protein I302_00738 [Kwoniella bestiolae CBS 10118]OCF29242.1 hypothetical protein I302_00738 [Kwoniella bestiolae CBS 10118]
MSTRQVGSSPKVSHSEKADDRLVGQYRSTTTSYQLSFTPSPTRWSRASHGSTTGDDPIDWKSGGSIHTPSGKFIFNPDGTIKEYTPPKEEQRPLYDKTW